ncbi:phosphotransferase [Rhodococcus hoagii]|nr:phosphotransferase [Prescottella equi]
MRWVEPSSDVLGQPFVVMDRVEGVVPVDNPPYVVRWLAARGQVGAVRCPATRFGGGVGGHPLDSRSGVAVAGARRRRRRRRPAQARRQRAHLLRVDAPREDGVRIPLLEEGFDWLEEHWPSAPSEPVLCWGDSRIGNIMYRDFAPVAVLDWELAALAPREVDVGWFVFFPGCSRTWRNSSADRAFPICSGARRWSPCTRSRPASNCATSTSISSTRPSATASSCPASSVAPSTSATVWRRRTPTSTSCTTTCSAG